MAKKPKAPIKPDTRLVTAGRDPQANHGFVNPPVYHASTVLYPTADDQVAHRARYSYGRRGTPTSEALEDALRELDGDGCAGVALLPSGLAAISAALLAVARAGDHVLVPDSVYRPTRNFCNGVFARLGVETTYYDPLIGAALQSCSSRIRAPCSSRPRDRKASRCRTFRPSPRSRMRKARSC